MRGIVSEEEKTNRERKRAKYIGLFLLALMLASTAGYAFLYSPVPEQVQQGTESTETGVYQNANGQWSLFLYGEELVLSYPPQELEAEIETNKTLSDYASSSLYVDSDDDFIYYEVASTLGRYSQNIQKACLGSCPEKNIPEKDCSSNVIIYRGSGENRVYQENNCVFIEGDLKTADSFIYRILGILQ